MVISDDGTAIYMGSASELMTFSATTNTLSKTDPTVVGNVLAISPDGTTLVITDPTRQLVYLYATASGAVVTSHDDVARRDHTKQSNPGALDVHGMVCDKRKGQYILGRCDCGTKRGSVLCGQHDNGAGILPDHNGNELHANTDNDNHFALSRCRSERADHRPDCGDQRWAAYSWGYDNSDRNVDGPCAYKRCDYTGRCRDTRSANGGLPYNGAEVHRNPGCEQRSEGSDGNGDYGR
jgi:hypothetical protein